VNGYRSELQAIALILGIALVAAFSAVIASADAGPSLVQSPTAVPTAPVLRPTPVPSVVSGPLDGLPTARRISERRPLAVIMDNFYPDARPQSGISKASVVFDALTEGGITRLMALFLEHDAGRIGPIRSARPYFVSWAAGFRALFVHAGGAPSALQLLRRTPSLADIDALQATKVFSRASDRSTPHDLYGSTSGARAAALQNSGTVVAPSPGLAFGIETPLHSRGRSSSFQVSFSTPQVSSPPAYSVTYRYARKRNVYLRSQGGVPFVDRVTGFQLAPKNVIVLYARLALVPNDPVGRISLAAVGGGRAILFQNGHVLRGMWSKASTSSPLSFNHADGRPMTLVPGQTWIEVAPPGDLTLATTS
jgi:Protein of unknown function (DUF3048) N-terminal domain/Protein of unknown function (DUF3048) C-terminal domain